MRKYPIKVAGREFTVLAQNKAEADNIYYRLRKLARVTACHCTLYGVRPANETEAERDALYAEAKAGSGFAESVFSPAPLPEEIATWFAALPAAIDKQFILAHDDEMDALFLKYLPIDDCRKTQAEIAETDANIAQAEAAREAKAETFRREHGSEYITVPEGKMAVVLVMTFDDSDSMSDYYSPHHTIGEPLLLSIAPKGARTEALARQALARYPELAEITFTWHTENYSMGHGNYLMSGSQGTYPHPGYDGRKEVAWSWEVQFDGAGNFLAYKNYPGKVIHNAG